MKKCLITLGAVLLLLVFAVSCGTAPAEPQPTPTPEPQATAEMSPTPDELGTSQKTDAPGATESSEPTARPQPSPIVLPVEKGDDVAYEEGENMQSEYTVSPYHPIICESFLVGGFHDGEWLSAFEVALEMDDTELYRYYDGDKYLGDGFGGKLSNVGDLGSIYDATPPYKSIEDVPLMEVRISADWEITPRKASEQSLNNDTYKQVVKDVIASFGVEVAMADVVLKQHYRLDFEGDGVDEVVLYAESPNDGWRYTSYVGAYSVLIVRKVVDGKAENFVLHADVVTGNEESLYGVEPMRYFEEVVGFYDLNGDGDLEMLNYMHYSNGAKYYIYEMEADGPNFAVGNGWTVNY